VRPVTAWLRARADNVAAGLLAAMFVTFIVQIFSRYVLDAPMGWTVEGCTTLWLWVVLWGAAFCLEDRDHVKFDLLYHTTGPRLRRVLAVSAALVIAAALLAALPATFDYITFYKIKKSAILKIRLDYVFSIYGVFAVAVIARYLWRAWSIIRGAPPDEPAEGRDVLVEGEEVHTP
jgi:C4-dicarboxylate transporter DctQ subunit